jgi:hypothetical protein
MLEGLGMVGRGKESLLGEGHARRLTAPPSCAMRFRSTLDDVDSAGTTGAGNLTRRLKLRKRWLACGADVKYLWQPSPHLV